MCEVTGLFAIRREDIPEYIRDGLRPEWLPVKLRIPEEKLTEIPDVAGHLTTVWTTEKGPQWKQTLEIRTSADIGSVDVLRGCWFLARISDDILMLIGDPAGKPPVMTYTQEIQNVSSRIIHISAVMADPPIMF
ncbi:MAG: hypothetical protein K2O24_00885 [Muribaculaceae bacterium]|nr:hypothetical protein [Muribaculaceae bacterium]